MSCIVHIVGRLGSEPETRAVGDQDVCSFSVASSRKVKGEEVTTWLRCQVWGKQADVAQRYLAKGRQIALHGRLEPREYQDREGVTKTSLDVSVIGFDLIGGQQEGGQDARPAQQRNGGGGNYRQDAPRGRAPVPKDQRSPRYDESLDEEIPF